MKHLVLTLWFVLFLSSSALAGVEYVTEEVCHAMSGCWMDTKTGECPDCVIERREVIHTHEVTPVIVEKPFVEPKRTVWAPKKRSKKTCDISSPMIKKEKLVNGYTRKVKWTCIIKPCDFIDSNGNLIDES